MLQFADDIIIWSSSSCINENSSKLEETLQKISSWLSKINLEIESQKTKAIIFSRRYKMHNMNMLSINNMNIQIVEKTKFLGLIFDKKLSWKHHIEYIVKKSEIRLNIIRYITKTWWGADPSCCLLI